MRHNKSNKCHSSCIKNPSKVFLHFSLLCCFTASAFSLTIWGFCSLYYLCELHCKLLREKVLPCIIVAMHCASFWCLKNIFSFNSYTTAAAKDQSYRLVGGGGEEKHVNWYEVWNKVLAMWPTGQDGTCLPSSGGKLDCSLFLQLKIKSLPEQHHEQYYQTAHASLWEDEEYRWRVLTSKREKFVSEALREY